MGRKTTAVVSLLALGALVGGLFGARRPPAHGATEPVHASSESTASIEVHVAGWVTRPGVVEVPEGSIVAEAIEAAGGLRPGALADQINLAAPIGSGEQIVVPGPGSDFGATVPSDGLVSLNRGDASALETLPGVGPVLAQRIVAFRDENGPYQKVEDLLQVPGIGEAKLASIRDLVKVP